MAHVHADGGERSRLAVVANVFPGLAEGMDGEGWRVRRRRLGALRLAPSADGLRRPAVLARSSAGSARWAGLRRLAPKIILRLSPRANAPNRNSLPTPGCRPTETSPSGTTDVSELSELPGSAAVEPRRHRSGAERPPCCRGPAGKVHRCRPLGCGAWRHPPRPGWQLMTCACVIVGWETPQPARRCPRAADPKDRKRGFTSDRRNCCNSDIEARCRDCRVAGASTTCTD
jgi:hypothetical protein